MTELSSWAIEALGLEEAAELPQLGMDAQNDRQVPQSFRTTDSLTAAVALSIGTAARTPLQLQ